MHIHNVEGTRGRGDLAAPGGQAMNFLGFPRPDGSAGIRNYVLVIPGGFVASKICDFVAGRARFTPPTTARAAPASDREAIARVLIGLGRNPNVAAVIVHTASPGAGYPELKPERLAEEIAASGKPVELVDRPRTAAPSAPSRRA